MRVVERRVSWVAWIARRAVDHRRAAADAAASSTAITWKIGGTQISVRNLHRGRDHRGRGAGAGAVAVGRARDAGCCAAPPTTCRSARWRPTRCAPAAVRRPDVRAVGGRHRPHGAGRAGRRDRRGHRLRPAEAGRQLRQRLRHPGRAQLRIGDMVKVDNFEGRITDISTRYTVIRALNGRESIVPNEMLITQRVENASLADPQVLLSTAVQVAYGTDLDGAAAAARGGRRRGAARAGRPGAGGAAAQLRRRRPGADAWASGSATPRTARATCAREVNLALLRAARTTRGVEIPFPQRVLRHVMADGSALPAAPGAPADGARRRRRGIQPPGRPLR